ncbi:tyrosine-type recombinase/integrase [Leptospira venezuelensis]|uniref:tyrosine-type recombinase/integrase n=1 Tax=Leptospira TaxID=171 RepID=UPI0005629DA0|nr:MULTISPECIES: tyrosine-type recombinase/integrase [Leptospira]
MGILKDKMISDMILHGYSDKSIKTYTDCMTIFTQHFKISPLDMNPTHVYNFFLHLRKTKLAESSIVVYYSAILLFYTFANRKYMMNLIPIPTKGRKIATVLNRTEIASFLEHCITLREKAIYTLIYSSGIRSGELEKLKVNCIDFERKSIFIQAGKNNCERYAILSDQAAFLLQQYIVSYRPISHLFYSSKGKNFSMSLRRIQARFKIIASEAGITKNATVHTLRHSFATHLLEDGYSIFYIQKLLGHLSIHSTLIYLHVSPHHLAEIPSPIEKVPIAKMGIFETDSQYDLGISML